MTLAQGNAITDKETGVRYTVEKYLTANYPVALAFAPDGRLFYTEKTTGNVRVVSADGELQRDPVIHLDTSALTERGMLGIALDPNYETNDYIWIFHTAEGTATQYASNNVVRFHEENGVGSDPQIMLSVPLTGGNLMHNGGNLHFDANGYLYVSFGDYENAANAQDMEVMQGKIHRFEVTDVGLVPAPGNPFPESSIYALGLRNPFDFTIDPISGRLFAVDNGPTCDDEINVILPGFNYGWGEDYKCVGTGTVDVERYAPPMMTFTPPEAPTGIVVYTHPAIPEWEGNLFFCAWNFGSLRRVVLNETRSKVESVHEIDLGDAQCRIDLEVGPEGALYFTTVGDDGGAIYRVMRDE
jgi:glucose/arabinose dehydrogenase